MRQKTTSWIVAALVGLAAVSWGSPAQAQVDQGPKPKVRAIKFEGLKRLAPAELLNRLRTKVGDTLDEAKLSRDAMRLYQLGEFESKDGTNSPVSFTVTELPGGGVTVTFLVHERKILTRLQIQGAKAFKTDEIKESLNSKVGRLYDPYVVMRDEGRLKDTLIDKGYAFAEVVTKTNIDKGVEVTFKVAPGPRVTIDEVYYKGVTILDDSGDLPDSAALEVKPRRFFGFFEEGYFVRSKVDDDLNKIERYYRSQGYLDADARLTDMEFSDDRSEVTLTVMVEEGARYHVRRVEILGNRRFSRKEIRKGLALRPGKPFLGNALIGDLDSIKKLYAGDAFIHAQANFEVVYNREKKLLDLVYSVVEGPQVRVDRVIVEGNEKTKQDVIRRELSVYPGELFDAEKIEESLGRIGRLRYFDDINLEFRPGSMKGSENLVIKVREARTGSFTLGGGVSSNAGVFGNFTLNQRNFDITDVPTSLEDVIKGRLFTGGGQNFTIQAQPGRQRQQYRISFSDPYFLDEPIVLGLEGFIFQRVRQDYQEGRIGFIPSLGYRITQDLIIQASYRIEQVRIYDIDTDATPTVLRDSGNNLVSGMELSLRLNKNLVDTQFIRYGGYGGSLSYEVLGGPFGGDVHLSRARARANWQTLLFNFPKGYKWVFGTRAEVAWQESFGSDSQTPIFERFFAGGVRSLRGFEFRSVGPRDGLQRDKPIGGDVLFLGTTDVNFPIFRRLLRGVFFLDYGLVSKDLEGFQADRIRAAYGFGARLYIPIFPAPVALDFALPLRARRIDDEQIFSFSLGFGF